MTDKELLELAAKAAGYETDLSYEYDEDWGFKIVGLKGWWNPLTDDGDALRLAVKCGMDINTYKSTKEVAAVRHHKTKQYQRYFVRVIYDNWEEATRRAIVLCAAETL